MIGGGYLVCDEPRGMACWAVVRGPFAYVSWTPDISQATPMPYRMAHDYASAFGTTVNGENRARVVETSRAAKVVKTIIERVEDAAMKAQELAMVDMCWTGDGS